jgi:hypothetical protein
MNRREVWNRVLRKFGTGNPENMTREQVEARAGYLRARGRHFEAHDLVKAWLLSPKVKH